MFSWRSYRVWQRHRDVFLRLWHSEAPAAIAEPVILLLAFGLGMGAYIGLIDGQRYIEFLAPGVIAAWTALPVIGVPVGKPGMSGLDALLSIAQMPPGVPVACMAVNGAKNAALYAAAILALKHPDVRQALERFRREQSQA